MAHAKGHEWKLQLVHDDKALRYMIHVSKLRAAGAEAGDQK
jgi:hypothetical protein